MHKLNKLTMSKKAEEYLHSKFGWNGLGSWEFDYEEVIDMLQEYSEQEKPKFKEGMLVRVIGNSNDHEIPIGSEIILGDKSESYDDDQTWLCDSPINIADYWYMAECDIEPIDTSLQVELEKLRKENAELRERMKKE